MRIDEALDRLRAMVADTGNKTWGLSRNDRAAVKAALGEVDGLRGEIADAQALAYNILPACDQGDLEKTLDEQIELLRVRHREEVERLKAASEQLQTLYANRGVRIEELVEICDRLEHEKARSDVEEHSQDESPAEPDDICGLCGLPGADKIPHPSRWAGERLPNRVYVHAECDEEECRRAHAALTQEDRVAFLRRRRRR